MNTQISKVLLIVVLSAILGVSAGAAVGTFTFKTTGASDTVEAVSLVYPQRVPEAGSVTTGSISDGSVTPAKISSGYNLLSDAEKTQALVGSSTVDFVANNATFSGFTTFGAGNTPMKVKVLTGETGGSGSSLSIAHGMAQSKIIAGASVVRGFPAEYTRYAGYKYSLHFDPTNAVISLHSGADANIQNASASIIILYVE